jgi:hypothetical protein
MLLCSVLAIMLGVIMLSVVMLSVVVLSVVMLSVVMLNVVMLSVVMLNVVMLNVGEPFFILPNIELAPFLFELHSNRFCQKNSNFETL